jgi:hypothetical protein
LWLWNSSVWIGAGDCEGRGQATLGYLTVTESVVSAGSQVGGIGGGMTENEGVIDVVRVEITDTRLDLVTSNSVGIGTGRALGASHISIASVIVTNCSGTISVLQLGSCIGIGSGIENTSQSIHDLVVSESHISLYSLLGAGIGTGCLDGGLRNANTANGRITGINITNCTLSIDNIWGAGIGSGSMFGFSRSDIGTILVQDSFLMISSDDGAGIGGGFIQGWSNHTFTSITIEDSELVIETNGAACIGGGVSQSTSNGSCFHVDEITIRFSNLSVVSNSGTGIGLGDTRSPGSSSSQVLQGRVFGANEIRRIVLEDCEVTGSTESGSIIGAGATTSQVSISDVQLRSVFVYCQGFGEGGVIGTGLIHEDGNATISAIEIVNSTIGAWGQGTVIGIGPMRSNGTGRINNISIMDSFLVGGLSGNATFIGIGSIHGNESAASIGDIILDHVNVSASCQAGVGIGIGSMYGHSSRATIGHILVTNDTVLILTANRSAGVGTGRVDAGIVKLSGITIEDSTAEIVSDTGAAIGAGETNGSASTIYISQIYIARSTLKLTSVHSAAIGAVTASTLAIHVESTNITASGVVGFQTNIAENESRVIFDAGSHIICQISDPSEPCANAYNLEVVGDEINVFNLSSRSLGPRNSSYQRRADSSKWGLIGYTLPSIREPIKNQRSIHFARMKTTTPSSYNFSVWFNNEAEPAFWFTAKTASIKSLNLLVPSSGSYRITYNESGTNVSGVMKDSHGHEYFDVGDTELFIPRSEMIDDKPEEPFQLEDWHIFLIVIAVIIFVFIVLELIVFFSMKESVPSEADQFIASAERHDVMLQELPLSDGDTEVLEGNPAHAPHEPLDKVAVAKKALGFLTEEYRRQDTAKKIVIWIIYLLIRVITMVMMFLISYLGFVSFFFLSVLMLESYLFTLFNNSFCQWSDLSVQIPMWFYFIPFFELLVSVNLDIIKAFFNKIWDRLDIEAITIIFEQQLNSRHPFRMITRLCGIFLYFTVMAILFLACLLAADSNIATHFRDPFAVICLLVPFCTLIRPLIMAWYIFIFDRQNLSPPDEIDVEGDEGKQVVPEAQDRPETKHKTLHFFDPEGLLEDNRWVDFLRSDVTAKVRPQLKKPLTLIATGVIFVFMIVVISLDIARMDQSSTRRQQELNEVVARLNRTAALHQIDVDVPSEKEAGLKTSDIAGIVIRCLVVIFVFPFTVLSHHGTIAIVWKVLGKRFGSIQFAKLIGVLMFLVSIIAFIAGPIVRSVYPWYLVSRISPKDWWDGNSTFLSATYEPQHALCAQNVGNWSLIQLAGLSAIAEARRDSSTPPEVIEYLRVLTAVPLVSSQPGNPNDLAMESQAVVAYDRTDRRLAVGLEAIPFNHNLGIALENSLIDYVYTAIGSCAPFFNLAYDNFLENLLTEISQALVTGILGPNRTGVYYLDHVNVTASLEMKTAFEVLEVLAVQPGIPLVVGHGANGLLVKASHFSYEPWRVSLEGSKVTGSPMETIAEADLEMKTRRIVNFYTRGSLFASFDDAALTNNQLPKYGIWPVIPPNPFETLCFAAAACATDVRFDRLCADVFGSHGHQLWNEHNVTLGEEKFRKLWAELGRQRIVDQNESRVQYQ